PPRLHGGRHPHGQVHERELFVDGNLRSYARVAGLHPRLVLPRLGSDLPDHRDRVEDPETLAVAHVEAAHVALDVSHSARDAAGTVCRAHDHDVASDHGRRVEAYFTRDEIDVLVVILFQIDDAVYAERGDGHAGLRVQRD